MPLIRPPAAKAAWGGLAGSPPAGDQTAGKQDAASKYSSSIFDSYAAACGGHGGDDEGDAAFAEGMQRVEEHLLSTQSEAAACLICLENIGASEPIWHCDAGCYEMVHLVCIQTWARQQLAVAQAKAEQRLNPDRFPGAAAEARSAACWGCPKCRTEYSGSAIPSAYRCFCGKLDDPPFDPWVAPHSCGERCERESQNCGHPCMLLCHPGPCPPCPRIVHAVCYCGAVESERRCGRHEFSCGGVCDQRLPCGHTCPEVCHEGECPPCGLISEVHCRCGSASRKLPCSQRGVFQCGRVCGQALDCGRHACGRVCHSGPCGGCELAGEKHCPCGKQVVPNAPCDLVVPPCGGTCDKLLACGMHRCNERCHTGPCTQVCRGLVEKTCSCGKTTKVVQCHEHVRCERRCTNMRSCGRHPCKKRCCSGDCPPCEEVCGRRLRCGNHRCPAPCHAGPCSPCPLAAHISCACGQTSYSVPCGREKLAPPPLCKHPCPVRPLCRHVGLLPRHRCHFGACPGPATGGAPLCPFPCSTPHSRCGHACQCPCCHDPLPPSVPDYQPPPPPAVPTGQEGAASRRKREATADPPPALKTAAAAAALAGSLPRCGEYLSFCPPCQVPVEVTCLGGHKTVQVPCSNAAHFCCGAPCGRALPCGNHSCAKPCHDPSADPCAACTAPCTKAGCQHPCPKQCHPGDCPRCQQSVAQACPCNRTTLHFECWEAAMGLPPERLRCAKTCHRGLPHCPHLCQDTCHTGACPAAESCSEEVAVRCGCKRLKRKLPCSEVQTLLVAAVGSRDYHAATPLRLLPCDAECAALAAAEAASKAGKAGRKGSGTAAGSGSGEEGEGGEVAAGKVKGAAVGGTSRAEGSRGGGGKRESREAREEERRKQRQLQESKARRKAALRVAVLSVLVAAALLLGYTVVRLVRLADEKAQDAWKPGGAEL